MANDFQKVKPGDDIVIKASVWNEFLGAAEFTRHQKGNTKAITKANLRNPSVVIIKNSTGANIDRCRAVAISGVLNIPTTNPTDEITAEFTNRLALVIGTPTTADAGLWLVTIKPVAAGELGLAAVSGVCQLWANVIAVGDTKVDIVGGSTTPETSDLQGYDLLWVAGGVGSATATGEQFVLVRIGTEKPENNKAYWGIITGAATANGTYEGHLLSAPASDIPAGANLAATDFGTPITGETILIINAKEIGSTEHDLTDVVNVDDKICQLTYLRTNDDGTRVFGMDKLFIGCDANDDIDDGGA